VTSLPETIPPLAPPPRLDPPPWVIQLLYDGGCPFCLREVHFLQKRDAGRGLISFVDINEQDYRPEAHGGITYEAAMGRIHALRADGTVLQNVEVFRQIYTALGLGWVYGATRWPLVGPLVDWIYGIWADQRLRLTGRPPLSSLLAERQHRQTCSSESPCQKNSAASRET
jgi:predicted DCC family thiol-disulfide oxidoreductase YuxK